MHCMTSNELRSRILQSSLSEFILWFQCSVRELISKPKKSKLIICSSPVRPRETTREKCVISYTSWYKSGETTAFTVSVKFLFRSLVGSLFFSRHDFSLKCCRESPGNRSFNKSPLKLFSSAGWRPPKPWLRAEEPAMLKHPLVFLISVHV